MKVALVHDWLTGMRGGERCLEAFLKIYPNADIFTLVHVSGSTTSEIDARVKQVSVLGKIPAISKFYRAFLVFYPAAAASLDLAGYDLVISLSHAAAKNVRVPRGTPHVCYCFTPMRYIWDQAKSYFRGVTYFAAQPFIRYLRRWDVAGAQHVTHFVAISNFVAARIRLFYKRKAFVIPPPVRMVDDVPRNLSAEEERLFSEQTEPFFLCAGALVPYKRIDVAVSAFRDLDVPLWIVGGGPELERLKAVAPSNVRFLGPVSDAVLWECYRRCRALIFPGIEDFGIVPVEVLSSGRPVIGVDAGGVGETVVGHRPWVGSHLVAQRECGVFIPKSGFGDASALVEAVRCFCQVESQFDADAAKRRAADFSYQRFFGAWAAFAQAVGVPPGRSADLSAPLYEPLADKVHSA